MAGSTWPQKRLQIRSILSATMPIGWVWVAATALIPYFLIGRGRGAGSLEMFGVARTTWLSLHVWSSIVVGLVTIAHVILNRRGVARSYRIVSGTKRDHAGGARWQRSGYTWVPALALLLVAVGGSFAYAAADSGGEGGQGTGSTTEQVRRDASVRPQHPTESGIGSLVEESSGARYRGGRNG
jgi:hypothetical protein